MSEVIHKKVKYGEGDLELPTEFEELEIIPGAEKALAMVRTQMQIEFARKLKPSTGGLIPKGAAKEIRDAVAGGVDINKVLEEIRKLKDASGEAA